MDAESDCALKMGMKSLKAHLGNVGLKEKKTSKADALMTLWMSCKVTFTKPLCKYVAG